MRKASFIVMVGAAVLVRLLAWSPVTQAHTNYDLDSVQGRWGFNEENIAAGTPGFATGIVHFFGDGSCTIVFAESGGGSSASPVDFRDPRKCEYSLDSTGKGTLTGPGIPEIRFVLTQHGNFIRYALCCQQGTSGRGEMNRM